MLGTPWQEIIENVQVDMQFSGIKENVAEHLNKSLGTLEYDLKNILEGSSKDASDWAEGVLKRIIREHIETVLPEFKAAVNVINDDKKTVVQIIVYPVGQLVQSIDYEMVSASIPNVRLLKIKQKYEAKMQDLRGLPLAYISKHQKDLEEYILSDLKIESDVVLHHLKPAVIISPAAKLDIHIRLESDEYKIWVAGYGDIGRRKNNIAGRAHLGKIGRAHF